MDVSVTEAFLHQGAGELEAKADLHLQITMSVLAVLILQSHGALAETRETGRRVQVAIVANVR